VPPFKDEHARGGSVCVCVRVCVCCLLRGWRVLAGQRAARISFESCNQGGNAPNELGLKSSELNWGGLWDLRIDKDQRDIFFVAEGHQSSEGEEVGRQIWGEEENVGGTREICLELILEVIVDARRLLRDGQSLGESRRG